MSIAELVEVQPEIKVIASPDAKVTVPKFASIVTAFSTIEPKSAT